jgi:hypothetical protein
MPVHACEQSPNSRQLMLPEEQNRPPFRNEINCNASQQYDAITLARMRIKSRHHHIAVLVLENGAFVACSTSATVKRTRASVSSMRARWTAGASSPGASKTFGTLKGTRPQRSRRALLPSWMEARQRSLFAPSALGLGPLITVLRMSRNGRLAAIFDWSFSCLLMVVCACMGPPVVCVHLGGFCWQMIVADDQGSPQW